MNVRGGLALNGILKLETDGFVRFLGSQTLSTGTIEFSGTSATIDLESGATVTLAPGTTIHGRTGNISGNNATLVNQGRIAADVAGGTIQITVSTFTNQGQVEELNGGNIIAPGF